METNKELEQENTHTAPIVEQQEQPDSAPQESQSSEENSPQKSWKELRQKADLADKYQKERDDIERERAYIQKERDAYLKLLYQAEEQVLANQQVQEPQEPDFDISTIDDDEILTGKELKNAWKKDQKRIARLEEKLNYNERFAQENAVENELKSTHSDFYTVLNPDNIKKLREMRPGLARSLALNPDLKEKALETYQAIKDLGIYTQDASSRDREIALKNSTKPRSVNSISPQSGRSPLDHASTYANGLTPELKKKLYEEMLEKSRG